MDAHTRCLEGSALQRHIILHSTGNRRKQYISVKGWQVQHNTVKSTTATNEAAGATTGTRSSRMSEVMYSCCSCCRKAKRSHAVASHSPLVAPVM